MLASLRRVARVPVCTRLFAPAAPRHLSSRTSPEDRSFLGLGSEAESGPEDERAPSRIHKPNRIILTRHGESMVRTARRDCWPERGAVANVYLWTSRAIHRGTSTTICTP
jgi:hypothetical protein